MKLTPAVGHLDIEVDGYDIRLPARTELMLQHLMGQMSDQELIRQVIEEAPQWIEMIEVKESEPHEK